MPLPQPLSPAELTLDLIQRYGSVVLEGGYAVKVGPASDAEQQAGVISLMSAGLPMIEKYAPLQWYRAQARCLGGDLSTPDILAQAVQFDTHGIVRKLCYQASNDSWYLIHLSNVTVGPSMHYDSPETWETLLFIELMIGSQVVANGPDYPDV